MFDVTASELLVIALVLVIVVGPKNLIQTSRKIGNWINQARRESVQLKQDVKKEIETVAAPAQTSGSELEEAAGSTRAELVPDVQELRDAVEELRRALGPLRRRRLRRRF